MEEVQMLVPGIFKKKNEIRECKRLIDWD